MKAPKAQKLRGPEPPRPQALTQTKKMSTPLLPPTILQLPSLKKVITVTKFDPLPSSQEYLFKGIHVLEACEQILIAKGKYVTKISLRTFKPLQSLCLHDQSIYQLVHIPKSNLFATASWDHQVKFFTHHPILKQTYSIRCDNEVYAIDHCQKNNLLAICGRFSNIYLHDLETKKTKEFSQPKIDIYVSVKFITGKNLLAATTYHQSKLIRVVIIDVKTMDLVYKIQDQSGFTKSSFCLRYDPSEEMLLVGNQSSEIECWKYQQKKGDRRFLKHMAHKDTLPSGQRAFYDDALCDWNGFKFVAIDSNADGSINKKPMLKFFTKYKQGDILQKELPWKESMPGLSKWKNMLVLGCGNGSKLALMG